MHLSKLPPRLPSLPIKTPIHASWPAYLALVVSCLLFGCAGKGDLTTKNLPADAQPVSAAIQPAFTNIKIAPGIYQIDPQRDTVLELPSGTSLQIPAGIFLSLDDRPVTQRVELRFREFHRAADLLTAGIPMRLKRDQGPDEWLQTAGMFEINGTANDQPVKIAPGKSLTVNLASQVDGPYDSWKFDPATGNWVNLGTSTVPQGEAGAQATAPDPETQRLRTLVANPPQNLVAANKKRVPINVI
ncbi:MAG: hypothetical protein ABIQ93_02225, partial [Saprospiraceae bacterium]